MIRRALVLLIMAGIYVAIRRSVPTEVRPAIDNEAEVQWANEGGANAAVSAWRRAYLRDETTGHAPTSSRSLPIQNFQT